MVNDIARLMKQSSLGPFRRHQIMILSRISEASCFLQMSKAREDYMDAFTLSIVVGDRRKNRFCMIHGSDTIPDTSPILYRCSISQNAVIGTQEKGWSIPLRRNLNDSEFKDNMQLILLLNNSLPQNF